MFSFGIFVRSFPLYFSPHLEPTPICFHCTRVRKTALGLSSATGWLCESRSSLQKQDSKVTSPVTSEHTKLFQFVWLLQNVQASSLQAARAPEMAHSKTNIINTFLSWMEKPLCLRDNCCVSLDRIISEHRTLTQPICSTKALRYTGK